VVDVTVRLWLLFNACCCALLPLQASRVGGRAASKKARVVAPVNYDGSSDDGGGQRSTTEFVKRTSNSAAAKRERAHADAAAADEEVEVVSGDDEVVGTHAGFADAMRKLLSRNLREGQTPVLAKRHTALMKQAEKERKAAEDAVAALKAKRAAGSRHMLTNTVESDIVLEKQLRRTATKGGTWHTWLLLARWSTSDRMWPCCCRAVVALFNAIRAQQKALEIGGDGEKSGKASAPAKAVSVVAKEVPKQSFLSLLKSASKSAPSGAPAPAVADGDGVGSRAVAGRKDAGGRTATAHDSDGVGSDSDGAAPSKRAAPASKAKAAAQGKRKWEVLDDDFKMSARRKDWAASSSDDASNSDHE
jgi:hypothetical protein